MKSSYNGKAIPSEGKPIGYGGGELQVPDAPIIPFIEGDGTGRDIWKASRRVFDAAVEQAYGGERRGAGVGDFPGGEKVHNLQGMAAHDNPQGHPGLPVAAYRTPTTPVGGGERSLDPY